MLISAFLLINAHCFDDIIHTLINAQLHAQSPQKIQHDHEYTGHCQEGETEREELHVYTHEFKLSVVTSRNLVKWI